MPSFDVVSDYDLQEVRNAVDQAGREVRTRYDFKGTDSAVELLDGAIRLDSSTEDRLAAVVLVLEEKLVRRKVSLKTLDWGTIEQAAGARYRRTARLRRGLGVTSPGLSTGLSRTWASRVSSHRPRVIRSG